jgi:2-keto-4-pentenoate hydratase
VDARDKPGHDELGAFQGVSHMTDILAAAEIIANARRSRTPLQPLAGDAAPQSEADGYLIQDALHGLLAADFGRRVGYKIGCTSPVMQQYLNIPHPAPAVCLQAAFMAAASR